MSVQQSGVSDDTTPPTVPDSTAAPTVQPPRRLFAVLLVIYGLWLTGLLLLNALT